MTASKIDIAPQQLEEVYRALGSDLCRTTEWLTRKLSFEFTMPWGRKGGSPREYAELREAKSTVCALKYPDPIEPVHKEDMAWALTLVRAAYRNDGQGEGVALFDKAAAMLGIDLAQAHPIPRDLDRKISNELKLDRPQANVALAAA